MGLSVGVLGNSNIAAEFEDTAWAHFMEASCVESESPLSKDAICDMRPEAGLAVFSEGVFSCPKAPGTDEEAFGEENFTSFALNEVPVSKDRTVLKDDERKTNASLCFAYREVGIESSLPCLTNELQNELGARSRDERDRCQLQEFEEKKLVNVDSLLGYCSNEKPANINFDSETSSHEPHEIPDSVSYLTKEERALRRRVFHKVHTRRSRAKLNEKLDHLRLILPSPPPGTSVKSKAQILDWAICCATRFSPKPLSVGTTPQTMPLRVSTPTLKDHGRARNKRGGRGPAHTTK